MSLTTAQIALLSRLADASGDGLAQDALGEPICHDPKTTYKQLLALEKSGHVRRGVGLRVWAITPAGARAVEAERAHAAWRAGR